jgi:hypothetical protein
MTFNILYINMLFSTFIVIVKYIFTFGIKLKVRLIKNRQISGDMFQGLSAPN